MLQRLQPKSMQNTKSINQLKNKSLHGPNTLEVRNYEEFDWDGRNGNGKKESNLG